MELLPLERLVKTGPVDHADWNYRPLLRSIQRQRFKLVLRLLPPGRIRRLLEVGYGSGVFMPELRLHCDELYGIDIHPENEAVCEQLERYGVSARLFQSDAAHTSFPSAYFDAIVVVSALEFILNIDEAAQEFARLLTSQGRLVAVAPKKSPLLDFALLIATGQSAKHDFGDRREAVLPTLSRHLQLVRTIAFPPVYVAYQFEPVKLVPDETVRTVRGEIGPKPETSVSRER